MADHLGGHSRTVYVASSSLCLDEFSFSWSAISSVVVGSSALSDQKHHSVTGFREPDKLPSCHRVSGCSVSCFFSSLQQPRSRWCVRILCHAASQYSWIFRLIQLRRRTVLNHFRPCRCSRRSCVLVRHASRQRFGSTVTSTSLFELTVPFSLLAVCAISEKKQVVGQQRVLVDLTSLRSFIVSWQWRRALLLKSNFYRVRPASVFMEQRLRRL